MASENNISQKRLTEKEIMLMLFREEIRAPSEDEHFEGSQEEINIFNEVFSQKSPSLFEKSRLKLQNMALCRIVDSSGREISSYNIGCILPAKKEISVSEDKTSTRTGTIPTGPPSSQIELALPEPVPPTPASSQKELEMVDQNEQRDESGTINLGGTKSVSQRDECDTMLDSVGTDGTVPVRIPPVSSQTGHETINRNLERETLYLGGTESVLQSLNCPVLGPVKAPVPSTHPSSLKELCMDLRAHANCLLADSGCKLELRKKKDRNAFDSVYHSPNNGPVMQNLPKPWISLGNQLMSSLNGSGSDHTGTPGKQWASIDEFKSDLESTLIYVESMMRDNSERNLLDRWLLLDPFVAVVSIDRKIWALKKGIAIKAINSRTSFLNEDELNVKQSCKKSLLPLMMSESQSEICGESKFDEEQFCSSGVNLHENTDKRLDEIPIGSTFAINHITQSTVPQKPGLILYPPAVPLSFDHQSTINELQGFEASFFQGTLAFDSSNGFRVKESLINWAVYSDIKSRSNNKRKSITDLKENGKKRVCRFNGQDLLISAIIMRKAAKYFKNPKKPPLNIQTGEKHSHKKRFSKGARMVLKLLIDMGVVSVNGKIRYEKSKMVKDGKLTRKGVLCQCCEEIFTVSGFRRHADSGSKPGLNLFIGSGKPYVTCLFNAWYVEYKERRERIKVRERESERNNDACGLCADVGELVCCDSCPASFHESCLPSQNIPEECWNCPRCRCDICGDLVDKSLEISSSNGFLECFQCGNKYHAKCRKDKVILNEDGSSNTWFCENACHQVYMYMKSKVGVSKYIGDGFYFSVLRCNHGEGKKTLNSEEIAMLAENNMKLAIALRLTEECFAPIVDPLTGIDLIPLVLYSWRVDTVNMDYKGFFTVVLEKDDRIISVASIRLHGTKAAEMPLIATSVENRKKGNCRRLISIVQQMLESLNVKMLLLSTVPNLLETWTSRFGFIPIEGIDKEMLCKLNLISLPGTVLLKKNLRDVSVELQGEGCSYTSCENQSKKPKP